MVTIALIVAYNLPKRSPSDELPKIQIIRPLYNHEEGGKSRAGENGNHPDTRQELRREPKTSASEINHRTYQGDHNVLFLPMTAFRKCEREPYSASDPEWQGFVALSKNADLRKEIKAKIAEDVAKGARRSKSLVRVLGTPIRVQFTSLEFTYPLLAPPEYEGSGLIWSDNALGWGTKKYSMVESQRLYKIFVPSTLISSLQSFFTAHTSAQLRAWKLPWSHSANKIDAQNLSPLATSQGPSKVWSDHPSKSSLPSSGDERMVNDRKTSYSASSLSVSSITADLARMALPQRTDDSALMAGSRSFLSTYFQKSKIGNVKIVRGSCLVTGEVGLKGPNGYCKFKVAAVYSPQEQILLSILGKVDGAWPNKQAPLRKGEPRDPRISNNGSNR